MKNRKDSSTPPAEQPSPRATGKRRGLVIVNTGDGKGKTTAALGLLVRAAGRGMRTRLFQFVKRPDTRFGEHVSLEKLEIPHQGLGDGFSWMSRDLDRSRELAAEGWAEAREAIAGGEYDLVVLDEITYPVNWKWIDSEDVLSSLRERPRHVHVVITGRDAPEALLALADTVTEMKKIKHAFEANVPAQKGIEH